jgi:hypothetical protein
LFVCERRQWRTHSRNDLNSYKKTNTNLKTTLTPPPTTPLLHTRRAARPACSPRSRSRRSPTSWAA